MFLGSLERSFVQGEAPSVTILYTHQAGHRVAEVLILDESRRVIAGMAHHA